MSENPTHTRPAAPGSSAPGDVVLYPMSAYNRGIRKPGQFHLIRFGQDQSEKLERLITVPHCHDFFEVIWVRQGSGRVQSDLRNFRVAPHTLFFTSPGQVHSWQLKGGAIGQIASFSAEFFAASSENPGFLSRLPFFYARTVDPILQLDAAESRRIEAVFRQLRAVADEPATGRDDLVRAYLTILLTLSRQFCARQASRSDASQPLTDLISRRFLLTLEENFSRLVQAGEYAKILGISRTHLNAHLQRELGRTASQIIHERIVLEAKRLLAHTNLTVAQIAHRLHFQDPSYFGRFFRRGSQQTPGEYRERAQTEMRAS